MSDAGPAGRVHIWHLILPGSLAPEVEEGLAQLLDPQERTRWQAATAPRRRTEILVGQALLRAAWGEALGVEPARIPITRGAQGKPELAIDSPVQANLSHSGPHFVVAVTAVGPVGVDVEMVRPHPAGVVRRFFRPAEQSLLGAIPDEGRDGAFFHLWTVKEACLKARGTESIAGLAHVDAGLSRAGVAGDAHWRSLRLAAGLASAVAVVGTPPSSYAVRPVTIEDLLAVAAP